LLANIASESGRALCLAYFLLIFAGATAGCIETIVHTTGGGFQHRPEHGVSPSNPEKIKKSLSPIPEFKPPKNQKVSSKPPKYTPHIPAIQQKSIPSTK
jgi:hypothetical protein